jgi:hypothetical protein
MTFQFGGGNCSLCKSPGTNKSTCPLNKNALHPNPAAHPNAAFGRVPPTHIVPPVKPIKPVAAFSREPLTHSVPPVKPIRPRSPPRSPPKATPPRASPPKATPPRASPPKATPPRAPPKASPPRVSPPSPEVSPKVLNMMDLPDELLLNIMDHTNLSSYSKLSQVNSRLNKISKTKRLLDKWNLPIIAEIFRKKIKYNLGFTNEQMLEIIHHLNGYKSYDTNKIKIGNTRESTTLFKHADGHTYVIKFEHPYRGDHEEIWLLDGKSYRKNGPAYTHFNKESKTQYWSDENGATLKIHTYNKKETGYDLVVKDNVEGTISKYNNGELEVQERIPTAEEIAANFPLPQHFG